MMKGIATAAAVLVGLAMVEEAMRAPPKRAPAPPPAVLPITYGPPIVLPDRIPVSPPRRMTFAGYDCTQDCSGHEAGYKWAEENDIEDAASCDGNSNSFNEGCAAFVEQR